MKIVNTLAIQLIFILMGCYILSSSQLLAKEVEGLFEISVPVENQTNLKRRAATRSALTEIVIRISGQSTAAANSVLRSNLKKSSAYIQRYLYREEDSVDEEGKPTKQLMLDLFFDEMSLRNLLRDAGLPRWGSNRPQVLLWIAIGDQQQRFLMGADNEAMLASMNRLPASGQENTTETDKPQIDLKEIINQTAADRGLPILLPLMDLEDSIAIDVADVWGRFVVPIRQASSRYESDAILAAQIMKTGDKWHTRWLLLHEGRTLSWEQESPSIDAALIAGIESTTDQLAEQYAVFEDSLLRNELLIAVSNVEQVEDYAHLMDYLQNLTSIHSVNVARVSNSAVQLRIDLIGEQQAMLQAISLNNRLFRESMPIISSDGMVTQLPSLYFRWNSEAQLP